MKNNTWPDDGTLKAADEWLGHAPKSKSTEDLREQVLNLSGVCSGPYDVPHRCSALHCGHCGLCDYSEEIINIVKEQRTQLLDELESGLPVSNYTIEELDAMNGHLDSRNFQSTHDQNVGYFRAVDQVKQLITNLRSNDG